MIFGVICIRTWNGRQKRYYYNYEPLADIGSYDYFPDMTEYVSEYYLGVAVSSGNRDYL